MSQNSMYEYTLLISQDSDRQGEDNQRADCN
jgi:hypothetical protein